MLITIIQVARPRENTIGSCKIGTIFHVELISKLSFYASLWLSRSLYMITTNLAPVFIIFDHVI